MFIADAQAHIWAPNTPERPWLPGRKPHCDTPLGADELLQLMGAAGVSRTVLIPPSWDADRNDLVLAAAQRYPDRFAAMGRFDLDAADAAQRVATWCEQPGMRGFRISFSLPRWAAALEAQRVDWLWRAAEEAQVPIALMVSQAQLPLIDAVAERFPALKIVICHLALPTEDKDEAAFRDFDRILPLARRPNVMVKVSALPAYTSDSYPFRALHPYIRRIYDAFGPRRMFWGTDLARLPCGYEQAISLFTEELPWLNADDKAWIMGRGLCDWLGWPLPLSAVKLRGGSGEG
jgi:predicted TIM-barrel fold metal-dependent hydrolase